MKKAIPPALFRGHDIRGLYPAELNEEGAYAIGLAFAMFLQKINPQKNTLRIAVGRDMRKSSPLLMKEFVKGFLKAGGSVFDIGLICTPMLYFAVSFFKLQGGVMISASHNPNPYNGIKLTREKAIPLGPKTGLFWIRDFLQSSDFSSFPTKKGGRSFKKSIAKDFLRFQFQKAGVKPGSLKGLSVALDAGNGAGGPIAMDILKKAGIKMFSLYTTPDGSFPFHAPDPLVKKNLKDLIALVQKKKPSLGVALDGDADRIIFVDEKGVPVSGDLITGLGAKLFLKKNSKVLFDIRSSNRVPQAIREAKGVPIPWKIGHATIKEKMRKEHIAFGGELSGHYYWGEDLFYDVPFIVLLKLCKALKEKHASLSELLRPLRTSFHSGEVNFPVSGKEQKIRELEQRYKKGRVNKLDGLRVDFEDWWFLVRPSNTEPLLRLVVEAKTKARMKEKVRELSSLITR